MSVIPWSPWEKLALKCGFWRVTKWRQLWISHCLVVTSRRMLGNISSQNARLRLKWKLIWRPFPLKWMWVPLHPLHFENELLNEYLFSEISFHQFRPPDWWHELGNRTSPLRGDVPWHFHPLPSRALLPPESAAEEWGRAADEDDRGESRDGSDRRWRQWRVHDPGGPCGVGYCWQRGAPGSPLRWLRLC